MEELTLHDYWKQWSNHVADREAARQEALSAVGTNLQDELREKKLQAAQLKADIYQLQARIAMAKGSYSKPAFDTEWAIKKANLRKKIEGLIAAELINGKNPNQIANDLGSKSINLFYNIKSNLEAQRTVTSRELEGIEWKWSRFTGTQRYGLSGNYVLMHGTVDTELEGLQCVFDFETGEFISGSTEVYNSDTEVNRARRAVTLAQILDGTYTGQVKERKNPYFEEVD